MKKVLAILITLFMGTTCVVLCACKEPSKENKDGAFYVMVYDGQGNEYRLESQGVQVVDAEYDYKVADVLEFTMQEFDAVTDAPLNLQAERDITLTRYKIKLDEPGKYEVKQYYPNYKGRGSILLRINVTVKEKPDTRPIPTVILEPGENCLEYVQNERYVYRYDGDTHLPIIKAYYEEEELFLSGGADTWSFLVDLEVIESEGSNNFQDIGVYKVKVYIHDTRWLSHSGDFQEVEIPITIEIVK